MARMIDKSVPFCYIYGMSEKKKKELRKVVVSVTYANGTDFDTYRIVVPSDSTTEKEMEWRMEYLKGFGTWGIESDSLIKEIE